LRDEVARKGAKGKPKFKASGMERETASSPDASTPDGTGPDAQLLGKRPGSAKRSKTKQLAIHEIVTLPPSQPLPPGSRRKGHRDFIVQGLKIQARNTCYRLEDRQAPDGSCLRGVVPATLNGGHFGPELRRWPNRGTPSPSRTDNSMWRWKRDVRSSSTNTKLAASRRVSSLAS